MTTLKLACLALLLAAVDCRADFIPPDARVLKIGDPAPAFSLPGIDGKTHALADYKSDLLMIVFLSNHCPDSHAVEARLLKFIETMKGQSFTVVAINPNNPDGTPSTNSATANTATVLRR